MAGPQDAAFQALVAQGNRARFAGEAEAAERAYRAALAMRPDNAPVKANLGLLLLSVGRYAEAWPLYEARRLIQQGGARVNGEAATEDGPVAVSGEVRISAGKKKHGLLIP